MQQPQQVRIPIMCHKIKCFGAKTGESHGDFEKAIEEYLDHMSQKGWQVSNVTCFAERHVMYMHIRPKMSPIAQPPPGIAVARQGLGTGRRKL